MKHSGRSVSPPGGSQRLRSRSPGSTHNSGAEPSHHRRTVRSRSFDKLREWGQNAERICEERRRRREQQQLLEAVMPHLRMQLDCPWCWTHGRLREWETWITEVERGILAADIRMPSRSTRGSRDEARPESNEGSRPFRGLRHLPKPLSWRDRGAENNPTQLQ